jgi:hypothetical protein
LGFGLKQTFVKLNRVPLKKFTNKLEMINEVERGRQTVNEEGRQTN